MSGLRQTPMEWRFDFFHAWLRVHLPAENGRCVQARCYAKRSRHPCELRLRAVAELVRDGHIPSEAASGVEQGSACCAAAEPSREATG